MELATRLKTEFNAGVRERGDSCFEADRVRIIDERADYIAALVDGANDASHFVQIDFSDVSDGSVGCSCECSEFSEGPCQHIWATIRSLEQHHHFSTLTGTEDLRLFAEDPEVLSSSIETTPKAVPETPAATEVVLNGQHGGNGQPAPEKKLDWRGELEELRDELPHFGPGTATPKEFSVQDRQHWFVINLADQQPGGPLALTIFQAVRKKNGEWGKPLLRTINQAESGALVDPIERRIFALLRPIENASYGNTTYGNSFYAGDTMFQIPAELIDDAIPLLLESRRFVWARRPERTLAKSFKVMWDDYSEWQLVLHLLPAKDEPLDDIQVYELNGRLWRGDEKRGLDYITLATSDGMMLIESTLTKLRPSDSAWIRRLTSGEANLRVHVKDLDEFVEELTKIPGLPHVEFDLQLEVDSIVGQPTGQLQIQRDEVSSGKQLVVDIAFRYGEQETTLGNSRRGFWDTDERHIVLRNLEAERGLLARLDEFPLQVATHHAYKPGQMTVHTKWLAPMVSKLSAEGWSVIAHGKRMRPASAFHIQVTTSEDWFDLDARVEFDDMATTLPALLKALNARRNYVVLDDGSRGVLPAEWLEKYERIAELGTAREDSIRFNASQALLLDALLSGQENVEFDEKFAEAVEKFHAFEGIKPKDEHDDFAGTLREYQRDGLGWLRFLRDFRWGGCLADDMGLGKTVQVLAMLQHRKHSRDDAKIPKTSLVVVPKSLIFNWIEEAGRFTSDLTVMDYTGTDRAARFDEISNHDVVVTTYGTLRRDITKFTDLEFDYAILDESQAIKNATSQAFKACRIIPARHRLAMTGTPIENHLGELWSLFEFLNPGMLGSSKSFRQVASADDSQSLEWLNRALKPFILRRTKEQVLTELPAKTEQTLYCEMTPNQLKLYNELRDYYRVQVNEKVNEIGVGRAKIHVLEALLRLRQAACDPRLLDQGSDIPGAKIELLVKQLEEVIANGHKALVFSQFTSLLALVKQEFEKKEWDYEYLDGRTRKRAECVKRFQSDESCRLFLISLKAGGHGLNLTAADYVFILDPWWNPAVEAQAIDRAHRIGQTRAVTAYRMIAQDTIEDKIVKLQRSKRELADAIITADKSLLSSMSVDDLQLLFS